MNENSERIPNVFVNYDDSDIEFAHWLSESLKTLGHHIWLDREALPGGVQTLAATHLALDESDVMLLLITPASMKSRHVTSAWTYFFCECEKELVPLLLKPLESPHTINFMLASLQQIDFSGNGREAALSTLNQTLHSIYMRLHNGANGDDSQPATLAHYGPQDHWGLRDELSASEAGLIRMSLDFPVRTYSDWLQEARSGIRILNTWTHTFVRYDKLFKEAVERGADLQVLLLDPSSPFARQRSLDLNLNSEEVPKNIRASVRQMASLYMELGGDDGRLELRLFNRLPSFSMHLVDDRGFIGFFPHATRTTGFPLWEIRMDSPFGEHVHDEFERIWEHSTPVDLSPYLPASVEEANQRLPEPLTPSELRVLGLTCAGLSNAQIAEELVVTIHTVRAHRNRTYSKLNISPPTPARLILKAKELGLC